MTHRVTLIAPGLLDPVRHLDKIPSNELPELQCLSTLFSRGQFSLAKTSDTSPNHFYQYLYNELSSDTSEVSIANLSYLAEQSNVNDKEEEKKWMLRADPAFMAADRDQLVLRQYQELGLSMVEANQLAEEINHFFQAYQEENFWKLYALTPEHWYLVSDKPINIETIPPEQVLGQSLKPYLLKGQDSQHWLNLFNEFQMILHQSNVNKKRIKENKTPVNSIWLWGAGQPIKELTKPQAKHYSKIYSDNIFIQGLAKYNNIKHVPLNNMFYNSIDNNQESELYVMESLEMCLHNQDLYGWVQRLKQLENDFFQPIINEIKSGRLNQLEIVSPTGIKLLITRKLLRRWWRKKNSFYTFLK